MIQIYAVLSYHIWFKNNKIINQLYIFSVIMTIIYDFFGFSGYNCKYYTTDLLKPKYIILFTCLVFLSYILTNLRGGKNIRMKYSEISEIHNEEMHRDIKEEILFFHKAANGDIKAIRENIEQRRFRDPEGVGTLSVDPVLNLKYHLVITIGILTRVCIERGMEPEQAFRISDFYIRKLDNALTEDAVEKIHDDVLLDFTGRMRLVLRDDHLSRPVSMCIDYIYAHLAERITIKELAEYAGVSTSFISREFSNELGKSISDYIREKKIEMSQDMLINTDMSILDIACQLSFSSQSHYIQAFKSLIGKTPKKYRTENQKFKWVASKNRNERERYPYLFDDDSQKNEH